MVNQVKFGEYLPSVPNNGKIMARLVSSKDKVKYDGIVGDLENKIEEKVVNYLDSIHLKPTTNPKIAKAI